MCFTPFTWFGSQVLRDRMHVFYRDHSSRPSKTSRELGRDLMKIITPTTNLPLRNPMNWRLWRGRPATAQGGQPAGPRTPPETSWNWPPPRLVPHTPFLRRSLRLRRPLLLLQLPRVYSGSGAKTAWPPSLVVLPPPPAHRAKPRVFLFNLCDMES